MNLARQFSLSSNLKHSPEQPVLGWTRPRTALNTARPSTKRSLRGLSVSRKASMQRPLSPQYFQQFESAWKQAPGTVTIHTRAFTQCFHSRPAVLWRPASRAEVRSSRGSRPSTGVRQIQESPRVQVCLTLPRGLESHAFS